MMTEAEASMWRDRLPAVDRLADLAASLGLQSAATAEPEDSANHPFGCLSERGLDQLQSLGGRLVDSGIVPSDCRIKQIRASNFDRTHRSVQSLMQGLTAAAGDSMSPAAPAGGHIRVTAAKDCVIDPWGASSAMSKLCSSMAQTCPAFVEREAAMTETRQALVANIPYFRQDPDGRWMWIRAADYFWCRHAYGDAIPPELAGLGEDTIEYVVWRFLRWYSNPAILRLAAGGILRDILAEMDEAVGGTTKPTPTPTPAPTDLSMYSGHDVTVLPILAALGVQRCPGMPASDSESAAEDWPLPLSSDAGHVVELDPVWPSYAASVAFELVSGGDEDNDHRGHERGSGGSGDADSSLTVRVNYDLQPVASMPLGDFRQLVNRINLA
eukprot:g4693.t1